jgi:hypothetical protein
MLVKLYPYTIINFIVISLNKNYLDSIYMENIFNIIFIFVLGYIIYKIYFLQKKSKSQSKQIDNFADLTPAPAPDFAPAPVPVFAPAPVPVFAPAFAPAPGPTPFVNGVNMDEYTKNYLSVFAKPSRSPNPSQPVNAPSFSLLDIPVIKSPDVSVNIIKRPSPEQVTRANIGTVRIQTEFSKIYPVGTNFDAIFDNYNNLISNTSISLLNEIFANVKTKANESSSIINFNPGFKQVKSLYIKQEDVDEYGKYFVSLMNSVATVGNSFILLKVNPISKEQFENQLRVNFTIEVKYKYPKADNTSLEIPPSDFTLLVNVVMLFEKSLTNSNSSTYVETFAIQGLSNFGFLAGYTKSKK